MPIRKDKKGRWHAEVCIDGQRLHRILPVGAGKKEAESTETELRKSLERTDYSNDPQLTAIMALYMTHSDTLRSEDTAKHHAARINTYLEGKKASDAKAVAVKIINGLRADGYKPATINRSLGTLKKALSLAWDQEIIPINYGEKIKRLKEHNEREVFLDMDQIKTLADKASMNVRAAIWIAVYTGMRRGEILKMNDAEIGDDTLTILSGNTKTLKRRTIPIVKPLVPWLTYLPMKIGAEGIKSGFQRARKAADMEHVNFHDLRHSTASLLIKKGVSLDVIRKILGHSTTKMTERYAHIEVEQQMKALKKAFK